MFIQNNRIQNFIATLLNWRSQAKRIWSGNLCFWQKLTLKSMENFIFWSLLTWPILAKYESHTVMVILIPAAVLFQDAAQSVLQKLDHPKLLCFLYIFLSSGQPTELLLKQDPAGSRTLHFFMGKPATRYAIQKDLLYPSVIVNVCNSRKKRKFCHTVPPRKI